MLDINELYIIDIRQTYILRIPCLMPIPSPLYDVSECVQAVCRPKVKKATYI